MDEKRVLVPAIFAFSAAAAYLFVLNSKEKALTASYENIAVLVAKVDIPERTALKPSMFEPVSVPTRFVQQDAFEVKTPSDLTLVANLLTKVRIPKGNQVTQSALMSMSPNAGLSVRIPPGYRGAVLPIDPGLKPLIKPGDRVDVLLTFEALMAGGKREKATLTLLQNVLVVSVGSDMGQGLDAARAKTLIEKDDRSALLNDRPLIGLALNPNELQYLALAQKQGDTFVGVRGLGDYDMHPMPMASMDALLNSPRSTP